MPSSMRALAFSRSARALRDVVDLAEDLIGVRRIGRQHRLKHHLLLLHVRLQVDELQTALLEDVVHTLLLLGVRVSFWTMSGFFHHMPRARRLRPCAAEAVGAAHWDAPPGPPRIGTPRPSPTNASAGGTERCWRPALERAGGGGC